MMKKERRKNEKPRMKINMVEKKSKKKRKDIPFMRYTQSRTEQICMYISPSSSPKNKRPLFLSIEFRGQEEKEEWN